MAFPRSWNEQCPSRPSEVNSIIHPNFKNVRHQIILRAPRVHSPSLEGCIGHSHLAYRACSRLVGGKSFHQWASTAYWKPTKAIFVNKNKFFYPIIQKCALCGSTKSSEVISSHKRCCGFTSGIFPPLFLLKDAPQILSHCWWVVLRGTTSLFSLVLSLPSGNCANFQGCG